MKCLSCFFQNSAANETWIMCLVGYIAYHASSKTVQQMKHETVQQRAMHLEF